MCTYGKHLPVNSLAVFGGVGINPQIASLRRGVDILVATPGRLLDHVQQRTVDLSAIEILVLDEADRMLDMGFIRDIRRIIALLPKQRQNLMFSATFSPDIRELAGGLLHNPVSIDVAPRNTPAELVTQRVIETNREQKKDLLLPSVRNARPGTRCWSSRAPSTAPMRWPRHSTRPASSRRRCTATSRRAPGRARSAISRTASWSRWSPPTSPRAASISTRCPMSSISRLPNIAEDYVHRIGRTGRAGIEGEATLAGLPRRARLPARHRKADQARPRARGDSRIRAFRPRRAAPGAAAAPPAQAAGSRPRRPTGIHPTRPGGPQQHRSGSRHR